MMWVMKEGLSFIAECKRGVSDLLMRSLILNAPNKVK